MTLRTGGSELSLPVPRDANCTVAPLVARDLDGVEVARLPERTCWDDVYTWELDGDDL